MARKSRKHRKRKTHSHRSVSAPRKRHRKRLSGGPAVVGSPKRRRRSARHTMGKRGKRKRHRMSGPSSGVSKALGLFFGGMTGLFTAEIGGAAIKRAAGPGPGMDLGLALGKTAVGLTTFAVGYAGMKDNSFVEGLGVGIGMSGANDGFRALQGAGVISGPGAVIIEIKDKGNGQQNQKQLNPPAAANVSGINVMGNSNTWHQAHVLNSY